MNAVERARRTPRALLRIVGSLAILALLLAVLPFDTLVAAIAGIPLAIWPAALAAYLAIHVVGTAKWRLTVNTAGAGLGWVAAVRCYYAGLFGNLFLPSIVGGDIVRAGLALRLSANKAAVLLGSVVDRALDMLALGLTAAIGALLLPSHLDASSRRIFAGLALLLALAAAALGLALWLLPARRFSLRTRRRLVKARRIVAAMARSPGRVALALALGMSLQLALVLLNAWLGRAVGIDAPFAVWLFAWPLAKVAGIVPVSQGGIGVREAAQVALLVPFGVPAVAAMAAGLAFEAVVISGALVGGLASALLGLRSAPRATGEGPGAKLPERGIAIGSTRRAR